MKFVIFSRSFLPTQNVDFVLDFERQLYHLKKWNLLVLLISFFRVAWKFSVHNNKEILYNWHADGIFCNISFLYFWSFVYDMRFRTRRTRNSGLILNEELYRGIFQSRSHARCFHNLFENNNNHLGGNIRGILRTSIPNPLHIGDCVIGHLQELLYRLYYIRITARGRQKRMWMEKMRKLYLKIIVISLQ